MASNAESFAELGMATELAKVVGGAIGGRTELRGTFTLNGVTNVVVANKNLRAGDFVDFMMVTPAGTVGAPPSIKALTYGTGFTVAGTAGDTSIYAYRICKG